MTRYRNNNLSKTFKDYAVPLIGLILILFLLYSIFSGDDNIENKKIINEQITDNNLGNIEVSLGNTDSKAYIIYENGKKVEIKDSISLQKSEKISVESGNVYIDFPLLAKINLGKNGELTYKDDGTLFLDSGKLWLESKSDLTFFMKFAEVSIPKGSIVSFYQTELESFIYSIDGDVLVSNLAGSSVQLNSFEKISIKSKDSNSADVNLDSEKTAIDDYFKLGSWFKENNGDVLLKKIKSNSGSLSGTGLLDKKSTIKDMGDLISFDNLVDESYIKENFVNLVGRYSPTKVGKITINNIESKLDSELGTFSIKSYSLNSKINDLVIKIYDKDSNLISKRILTIYTNNPANTGNIGNIKTSKTLENFPVRATDFYIYEPTKTGKLITKSSQITIRGKVTNKDVKSVVVNGYKLKSYNGSTWRYHAFTNQGTLKNGANNYEIKYLDKDGKLIYKEYYSIYKEFIKPVKKEIKKISDEVKIN